MKEEKKGNILRCKQGYNPNSSSVGSHLPYFLAFAVGSGMLSIIIHNILEYADKRLKNNKAHIIKSDDVED